MRYTISFLLATLGVTQAFAEVPKVLTDFAPVQSLVAQVMGDLGAPATLLPRGSDVHDFQLRPSQAADLAGADLLIWLGPQMTPWLARARDAGQGGAELRLLEVPQTLLRPFDGHAHGQDDAGHADPHAWLDPGNAALWLGAIGDALAQRDSENAETYHANAKQAQADILALDQSLKAQLAPIATKAFMVEHNAYGYFVAHFGLTLTDALRSGDASAPGAAHLGAMRDALTAGQVVCMFPEIGHDPKQAAQLLDGTSTRLGAPLDPEGIDLEPGPQLYHRLMQGLADHLVDCLAAS